jgi:hypothetical protein
MKLLGRLLRRAPLLLTLGLAACASTADGGGPSADRSLDLIALAAGCAVLVIIGSLMYYDNQNN